MRPAGLFDQVTGLPLPVAAGRFAEAGVPVFPCEWSASATDGSSRSSQWTSQ